MNRYCEAWTLNTVSCPCVFSSKSLLYLLQSGHSFSFPSHFFNWNICYLLITLLELLWMEVVELLAAQYLKVYSVY